MLLSLSALSASAFLPVSNREISLRQGSSTRLFRTSVDSVSYKPSLNLQDEPFDTIIIGSGIGGLAAGAILAQSKENHKVLVLEQHYRCGGCCHTFTKKGYKFGTGIHYVGEVGPNDESSTGMRLRELLQAVVPAGDCIPWSPMQANYDTIVLGKGNRDDPTTRRYEIYAREHQERLKDQFPNDHEAIDEYFVLCEKARTSFVRAVSFKMLPRTLVKVLRWTGLVRLLDKGYHKFASVSLRHVIDSLTDNPDLKAAFAYNWGDYGSLPSETPFLMHTLLVAHYHNGGYYPTGGSDVIPQKIIPVITAHGGQVLANAPVRRIIMDAKGKTATGVELMDGTKIHAKHAVVSDAGILNTCRYLVPVEKGAAMMKRLTVPAKTSLDKAKADQPSSVLDNGTTGLCLFVGLKGDHDSDLHLPRSQLWMYPSAEIEQDIDKFPETLKEGLTKLKPHDLTPLFVGAPSGKDADWSKNFPNKSTLEIITYVPWNWFQKFAPTQPKDDSGAVDLGGKPGSHDKEYQQAKAALAALMYARARQGLVDSGASDSLPDTLADVDTYELGTPLTYAHYLWNDRGAFYGLSHDMHRFQPRIFFQELRPDVPEVKGLFLTGQDVAVSSLTGALCGAYLCASKILGVLDPFTLLNEVENNRVVSATASKEQSTSDQSGSQAEDKDTLTAVVD